MKQQLTTFQLTRSFNNCMVSTYGLKCCKSVTLFCKALWRLTKVAYVAVLQSFMSVYPKYYFNIRMATFLANHTPLYISQLSHIDYSFPRAYGVGVYIYVVYIPPHMAGASFGRFKNRSGGWV